MSEAGVNLLADVSRLAAIGPWDALSLLSDYVKLYRRILKETRIRGTTVAILVDFPEFNLKLARRLKKMGVFVCYFIGPQILGLAFLSGPADQPLGGSDAGGAAV